MKIGVAISGGVDSALTAFLLKETGAEVIGYTMLLTDGGDTERAASVAEKLNIRHVVVDLRERFERDVLSYFASEYAAGRTPSPCCRCNPLIKFGALWERMAADGCEKMATGHYARIVQNDGRFELRKAVDLTKDQSYFLSRLTQNELSRVCFPLGDMHKSDVKARAEELGLVPQEQRESQDLCFVSNGGHAEFVLARFPELKRRGDIVDTSGKKLGEHDGAFQYTIGQRRGLGLGGGPWFVTEVDVPQNRVVIGHADDMKCRSVKVRNLNWLGDNSGALEVRLRYQMKPLAATITQIDDVFWNIVFSADAPRVPAGQLAVAYNGDTVIASGWIC